MNSRNLQDLGVELSGGQMQQILSLLLAATRCRCGQLVNLMESAGLLPAHLCTSH